MKNLLLLFIFISSISQAANLTIKNDVDFFSETAHLDFSAPKSCDFEATINSQTVKGSYKLNGKGCAVVDLKATEATTKDVDSFICAMLVTSLNTTGKDLATSCESKKISNNFVSLDKCGPRKNLHVEINLTTLTDSITASDGNVRLLSTTYKYSDDHLLYPDAVAFETTLSKQKIDKITYLKGMPLFFNGHNGSAQTKFSFSNCVKNH